MNFPIAVALMSSALSVYVAMLSKRFSVAPGWRDQHWFAVAAIAAAAYSALNVPVLMGTSERVVVSCVRLQVFFGMLQLASWILYTSEYLKEPGGRGQRWGVGAVLLLGALALVPGLAFTREIRLRPNAMFGVVYRDPVSTLFRGAVLLVLLLGFLPLVVRFVRARRRVNYALTHAAAVCVMVLLGANDSIAAMGLVSTPYLLDLAYVIPVAVVGWVLTSRFATDARALDGMRSRLEVLVEHRTRELGQVQEALHRAEKLAALGQLSAGVAHEVNSPAAVISANLMYLEQRIAEGRIPAEELEPVREAGQALRRIGVISRQLLHAGQLAATGPVSHPMAVALVAREALATARVRCPDRVALAERVPGDLLVSGQEDLLHQVLVNLVVNGAQAIPEGRAGKVEIAGRREPGRVLITVDDDGAGMGPEVLRRVFEPFFTTKSFGDGSGLGLAVSRGLIVGLGGDLRLESQVGRGTRAVIDLPEAEAVPMLESEPSAV